MKKIKNNKPYHFTECGLDNIYLLNGFETYETPDGKGVSISHIDELHEAIASSLVSGERPLKYKEIRFLRHFLDISQTDLAELLGFETQAIARWEKNQNKVDPSAERLIRFLILEKLGKRPEVTALLKMLSEKDNCEFRKEREFRITNGDWEQAA